MANFCDKCSTLWQEIQEFEFFKLENLPVISADLLRLHAIMLKLKLSTELEHLEIPNPKATKQPINKALSTKAHSASSQHSPAVTRAKLANAKGSLSGLPNATADLNSKKMANLKNTPVARTRSSPQLATTHTSDSTGSNKEAPQLASTVFKTPLSSSLQSTVKENSSPLDIPLPAKVIETKTTNKDQNNLNKRIVCSGSDNSLIGIVTPVRKWLYIGKLDINTTELNIKTYVSSKLNLPCDLMPCHKLVSKNRKLDEMSFISFRLLVDEQHIPTLLDCNFWPAHIEVCLFKSLKNGNRSSQ